MRVWLGLLAILAFGNLLTLDPGPLAAPLGRPEVQWSIEVLPGSPWVGVMPAQHFALRNILTGKFLTFSGQTPAWQDSMVRSFSWARLGAPTVPLRYGMSVVIISQGRYVSAATTASRAPVILVDSSSFVSAQDGLSAHEWRFSGGSAGQLVPVSRPVILRNSIRSDALMFCPEARGVTLSWQRECGLQGKGPQGPATGITVPTPP